MGVGRNTAAHLLRLPRTPEDLMNQTDLAYLKQELGVSNDFRAEWSRLSDDEKAELKEAAKVERAHLEKLAA